MASDSGPGPACRVAESSPDDDDRLRRRVLWALPTGLYVLGSAADGAVNCMTISWVTQVATAPKLVAVSVEAASLTRRLIEQGGAFSLSLLPRSERAVVRRFVKPARDVSLEPDGTGTISGVAVRLGHAGTPVLTCAAAWLECDVRQQVDLGSHVCFVGEVVVAGADEAAEPLEVLRMEDTRMSYGG